MGEGTGDTRRFRCARRRGVLLPVGTQIDVKINQKVQGGVTVLGKW